MQKSFMHILRNIKGEVSIASLGTTTRLQLSNLYINLTTLFKICTHN